MCRRLDALIMQIAMPRAVIQLEALTVEESEAEQIPRQLIFQLITAECRLEFEFA